MSNDLQNRCRGALLGLAIGDALGTTLEFREPGSFRPITEIVGGGPFRLKPGEWTDDTSMALCLAESLIAWNGNNLHDQVKRYTAWWKNGVNSVTGECFDIGNTVRTALEAYAVTGNPKSGPTDSMSAGNGSIMRLAPIPIFYANDGAQAIEAAAESSQVTHGARESVDACKLMTAILVGLLRGGSKQDVLSQGYLEAADGLDVQNLAPAIRKLAEGSYKEMEMGAVRGTGYVVRSLEAALWSLWHSASFEQGAVLAVNFGDDADTTGAVFGQIAGAYHGADGIPASWLDKLAWRSHIVALADQLRTHARRGLVNPSGDASEFRGNLLTE